MAYVTSTRRAPHGFADRIGAVVKSVGTYFSRRAIYNRTVSELNALSSRDLADLGIHRSMISRIAAEAAYGK